MLNQEAVNLGIAPDFVLRDQEDRPFRLSIESAGKWSLLVFYRGHWCPYCRRYLGKLQANLQSFANRNVLPVAISPEPIHTLQYLASSLSIQFRLLSDFRGEVISQFGVRNELISQRLIVPHPSVVILDPARRIRYRRVDINYKTRATMPTLFRMIDQVQQNEGGAMSQTEAALP